jgi:hypothetical protein
MKKYWRKSVAIMFLSLLSMQVVCAQSNCVFDSKDLSESKFKNNKSISKYTWDKGTREARIITNDRNLVAAKYWSCEHYGAHTVMLMGPYPQDDLDTLNKKFTQLADMVLDANEAKIVKNYLSKNTVSISTESAQIDIPNTGYSEFYLRYTVVYDSAVLEIKFYRD